MNLQPHFEIRVRQQGRWIIQSQYPVSDEKAAIEGAKKLEKQTEIEAVKLILEVCDNKAGTQKSHLIYKSAGVIATNDEIDSTTSFFENVSDEKETTGSKSETQDPGVTDRTALSTDLKTPPSGSPTRLLAKILLILLFSLFLGSMAAFIAIEMIEGTTIFGDRISGSQATNLVIGVFAATFLASVSLLSIAYIKRKDFNFRPRRRYPRRRYKTDPHSNQSQLAAKKNSNNPKKRDVMEQLDNAMAGSENFVLPNQTSNKVDNLEGENSVDSSSETNMQPHTIDTLSPNAEEQKAYLIEFLDSSLGKSSNEPNKLDSFKTFGVNLFLAGACQKLSDKREVDYRSRIWILIDLVQSLGLKKSHATAFVDKYEGYLIQDPYYMEMYQAGLNAMETHLQNPENGVNCLKEALKKWNQSERALEEKKPITLLLTKISAQKTTLGPNQSSFQENLKVHNDVVRRALAAKNGFEISISKHGIIASFDNVSDSLDAGIQIQRAVLSYSQEAPASPLNIKIGINTSDPGIDERDSFDTMVQTCENIASKAKFNEIFVSDVVRGACKGEGYTFSSKGSHQITGFQGGIDLYEVLWRTEPVS